ncbi:DUF2177 family protein [Emticicia agri]|uniref:DUF2177 family protein n=1 Tax=Emticicia agri TaxID=2492393 RepID=A0A4Q5M355_9BACT|nr:DUF2177 family protein [Emticicia agri]RYU96712.1 DUF2177 family protein [Emticicia agri]
MKILLVFILTTVIFAAIDLVWLGVIAKNLYQQKIGFIMADEVNWIAALIFYLMYIGGILYFVIFPSLDNGNWQTALLKGAILGALCYGTYDLTNWATLKNWPSEIVIIDILWGAFLTGLTATLSFIVSQKFL